MGEKKKEKTWKHLGNIPTRAHICVKLVVATYLVVLPDRVN